MSHGCDPESAKLVTCITLEPTLAARARVLLVGQLRALAEEDADRGFGDCYLRSSETGNLKPVSLGIDRNQFEGAGAIEYDQIKLSAVVLGA